MSWGHRVIRTGRVTACMLLVGKRVNTEVNYQVHKPFQMVIMRIRVC